MPEARGVVVVTLTGKPPSPNSKRGNTRGAAIAQSQQVARLREDARRMALDRVNRQRPAGIPWREVRLEIEFGLKRGNRDADNLIAGVKPYIDGLVDAGIMVDDSVKVVKQFVVGYHVNGKADWTTFKVTDIAEAE